MRGEATVRRLIPHVLAFPPVHRVRMGNLWSRAAEAATAPVEEREKSAVGRVTHAQLLEIAEKKKEDLNANDPEMAARIIAGTARSMGIEVAK